MLKNKRIVVFGGAGSIGSAIVKRLAPKNKIFIFDISENAYGLSQELKQNGFWVEARVGDIRDKDTIRDFFDDFKPQIVLNAAALKEVPIMELYPLEAIKTNVLGHYNIVHTAKTWECVEKLIFISTDNVVNSNSIMGATKRLSEIITINSGYSVVRLGNIIGSRGSLTTIWQKQEDEGKSLTVTDGKMKRYMMTIEEATEFIVSVIDKEGGKIYVPKLKQKISLVMWFILIVIFFQLMY